MKKVEINKDFKFFFLFLLFFIQISKINTPFGISQDI